ncbi:5-methyltetrahydropteroyltriglutamate--homocysteine S-methyltransferase [Chitinimonas sp. BJB300]|uniref:5-methyltetrahydropteroyltriglutamate-- homocysteine S-methyltransferase n=1 Tax=Chitinimonas sp. BJB300 TaxID=1559339 RepID=UPI000C0DB45F|nr:5-methyltetrahydropteroyltriglutamate--homocysteine S-methyltransferase [Chitinimonas sp. BJB300]PHV12370.1 5-methyltetrahydropteroyltriglutamate--homocysteine S-methyltransferase [Chitinimonas sp. BJB300]TSJ91079.1 5-methyltetrahydropteroyltriglutamate--homocysteine S-methyltransferase [Chitinimonas sp. BJB300]
MLTTHILGFPRIGSQRELKFAVEKFWGGDLDQAGLEAKGRELRLRHWQWQREAGLRFVAVGDFSYYDQILDATVLLGAPPQRFGFEPAKLSRRQYFELARGNAAQPACEMTKWFDTNYHFLKPEFDADTRFDGGPQWLIDELQEAQLAGFKAKVQLVGPLTLLKLARVHGIDALSLLPRLVPAYVRLLKQLVAQGCEWVQLDEPILGLDLDAQWLAAFAPVYRELAAAHSHILLATYFAGVADKATLLQALPVAGLHLDAVREVGQLNAFVDWPIGKVLSVGIIDGRNIWKADLDVALDRLSPLYVRLGESLWLAPSCSLLHVPTDLDQETRLTDDIKDGLSFAKQKLAELTTLSRALCLGRSVCFQALETNRIALTRFRELPARNSAVVAARLAELPDHNRGLAYTGRSKLQRARLQLPLLPTTTIGSFPQTTEIRTQRAAFKRGELSQADYTHAMKAEIASAVAKQEELGIDVLVHGEAERSDMVDYFAEQLVGVAVCQHGWVQSYGSRCVKPPVIWGDVSRPHAMTVEWTRYAQTLTPKPMKGMLTGPVTLVQWAFVRDDKPRAEVAYQMALALRDEVAELDAAGIAVIQIDEPAFREGLPLKQADWPAYLDWAVTTFKLSAAGARPETQIHTHMCYSEFEDILPAIADMDADVITIETSRSAMTLLDAFGEFAYPNEIGPGVYDIHSPRVPPVVEMTTLLEKALKVIPAERLWVNPDCGLKTRGWAETEAALRNMLSATWQIRTRLAAGDRMSPTLSKTIAGGHVACGCSHRGE